MKAMRYAVLLNVSVILALLLSACGGKDAVPTVAPTPTKGGATPTAVATLAPTPTPASVLVDDTAKKFEGGATLTLDEIRNAKPGGTLELGSNLHLVPDPAQVASGIFDLTWGGVWEKLSEWDQFNPSQCVPEMAAKWTIDSTGKVYTFNLNPGIKWHDGSAFTADDVVATLEYRKWMWQTNRRGLRIGGLTDTMYASSRAIDPLTAEITLKAPSLAFLPITCSANFVIVPKKAVDLRINKPGPVVDLYNFTDNGPVGTGPFKWVSTSTESQNLIRNPNYWRKDPFNKALPYLDAIHLTAINDQNVRIGALQTGRIHFWPTYPNLDKATADDIVKRLGNKVYVVRGDVMLTEGLIMQGQYPLNKERDFRWALALASNVWEFQDRIFQGQMSMGQVISRGIFSKEALPEDEIAKSLLYNKDRTAAQAEARRLLAKLGYVPANMEIPMSCSQGTALNCEEVELFAKQLRDFGFKTKIDVTLPGAPAPTGDAATRYAFTSGTISISAIEATVVINNRFLQLEADWMDANGQRAAGAVKLRSLVETSFGATDPAVRLKALQDAQRAIMNEDTNIVMFGYWKWNMPVYSQVRGLFRFATMSEGQQHRYTWINQ